MLSEIKGEYGKTIYDLVIEAYGSADYTYKFIQDNNIPGIGFNLNSINGKVYFFEKLNNPSPELNGSSKEKTTLKETIGLYSQNLFDIALMSHGNLDNILKLVSSNDIDNINEHSVFNKKFKFEEAEIIDKRFFDYINSNNIVLATKENRSAIGVGRAYSSGYSIAYS